MSKERGRHQAAELIPGRIWDKYAWRKHAPPYLALHGIGPRAARFDSRSCQFASTVLSLFSSFFLCQTAPLSSHQPCCATRTAPTRTNCATARRGSPTCLLVREGTREEPTNCPTLVHQLDLGHQSRASATRQSAPLIVRHPSNSASVPLQCSNTGTDEYRVGEQNWHLEFAPAADAHCWDPRQ